MSQALDEAQKRAEAAADDIADWDNRKEAMHAERDDLTTTVTVRTTY